MQYLCPCLEIGKSNVSLGSASCRQYRTISFPAEAPLMGSIDKGKAVGGGGEIVIGELNGFCSGDDSILEM